MDQQDEKTLTAQQAEAAQSAQADQPKKRRTRKSAAGADAPQAPATPAAEVQAPAEAKAKKRGRKAAEQAAADTAGLATPESAAPIEAEAKTKKRSRKAKAAETPDASATPAAGTAAPLDDAPLEATPSGEAPLYVAPLSDAKGGAAPEQAAQAEPAAPAGEAVRTDLPERTPRRRRRRKKSPPKVIEAQSAPRQPGAQQPYVAPDAEKQDQRHGDRHAARRRLYEVDNSDLPEGMPPVLPLLESRPDAAPEKGMAKRVPRPEKKTRKLEPGEVGDAILAFLRERNMPASNEHLMSELGVNAGDFVSAVDELMGQGKIFATRKHKLALPEQIGYVSGRLQVTSKGYGFLLPDDASGDVFLPASALGGALNGDRIVVHIVESRGNSREGEIIAVTQRANTRVVGTVVRERRGFLLFPDSARIAQAFVIPKGRLMGAKPDQKVVCDIDYSNAEQPVAHVREVLGFSTDVGTDVLSIIRAHDIPEEFSKAAMHYVKSVPEIVPADDILRREDLRAMTIVTVDGADAKDLDDAISLEKLSNGHYLLGVHIADVSHYVKEGAPLDRDALKRGTSVYFVDRVIPMLPRELSNGICSLNPDVDRLTLSCFMEIDGRGSVVNHRFAETVIRSKYRLTYGDVTAAIEGDAAMAAKYEKILPLFSNMTELCGILRARRDRRGSIDFDIPEAKIKLDALGKPVEVSVYPRGISNRIIEEFMLACNETVAAHMAYLERPMLYRVHETPDPEKIAELGVFLASFGLTLKGAKDDIRPKAVQAALLKTHGKPEEAIVARVMVRSLKKARYAEENLGHFGLAAENYCHFTSPIRRYPDLMVHRILKELLHGQLTDKRSEQLRANMKAIADQCSERERAAMEAEREVDDLKKCEYMAGFLGEVFDGIISGVTSSGMFVELPNTCEGFVRINDLRDDAYSYEEKNYRFVGRHTGRIFRLGDNATVQVVAADVATRRVDFILVEREVPRGKKPKTRPRRKTDR